MCLCTTLVYMSYILQNIRDRVEKLESHLQVAKKKLERERSGKVGFK